MRPPRCAKEIKKFALNPCLSGEAGVGVIVRCLRSLSALDGGREGHIHTYVVYVAGYTYMVRVQPRFTNSLVKDRR